MVTELEELGKRAVACKHWRWMPGMKAETSHRILNQEKLDGYPVAFTPWGYRTALDAESFPDLSEPATLGCLLALVREAWGKPHAYVEYSNKWKVAFYCEVGTRAFSSTTEAAALVAALEAAP